MSPFQIWLQWQDESADAGVNGGLFEAHSTSYTAAFRALNAAIAGLGEHVSAPIVNAGCPVGEAMSAGTFWTASLFGIHSAGVAYTTPPNAGNDGELTTNPWGKVMNAQKLCGLSLPASAADLTKIDTSSVFGLVMEMAFVTIPGIAGSPPFGSDGIPLVTVTSSLGTPVTGYGVNVANTTPPAGGTGRPFQCWIQWREFHAGPGGAHVGTAAQTWVNNLIALVQGLEGLGMQITKAGCSPVLNYGQEDNAWGSLQQTAPDPLDASSMQQYDFWVMSLFGFDGDLGGAPPANAAQSWAAVAKAGATPGPVGRFLNLLAGSGPLSPLLPKAQQSTYAGGIDPGSVALTVNVSNMDGDDVLADSFLACGAAPS